MKFDTENKDSIDEIYLVLQKDNSGNEVLCAKVTKSGFMPMVFLNEIVLLNCKEDIEQMAKDTGKSIRIYKFKKSEIIEEINKGN